MATKYFLDTEANGDWNDAGNWWLNDDGTGATTIPTTSDDVILLASVTTNSGDPAVCNTLVMPDSGFASHVLDCGGVTTIAGATFGGSSINNTTVNGGAVFNGSSSNGSGTVNGGAVFNGGYNSAAGAVNDGAVFNTNSDNQGAVEGGAVFNDAYNNGGTVNGGAVFNGTAYNFSGGTCDTAVYAATAAAYQLANNYAGTVIGSCTVRIGINGSSILGLL